MQKKKKVMETLFFQDNKKKNKICMAKAHTGGMDPDVATCSQSPVDESYLHTSPFGTVSHLTSTISTAP